VVRQLPTRWTWFSGSLAILGKVSRLGVRIGLDAVKSRIETQEGGNWGEQC